MTVTVSVVQQEQTRDDEPPPGTAIIRPLRHVRAVRQRHLLLFDDPAQAAQSRSVRAWAWALGESTLAPVTDRDTAVPPGRPEIEAEIAEADQRAFRSDQDNRADTAAEILRWLIGGDDGVPIEVTNPGELVGGFGDVVRSREHLACVLALATERQREAVLRTRDLDTSPAVRQAVQEEADYCAGVIATLTWVLGHRPHAPISQETVDGSASRVLKRERLHAQDIMEQVRYPWLSDRLPSRAYGEGVKITITWLLGNLTTQPLDPASR
jgi:hypothetical protein